MLKRHDKKQTPQDTRKQREEDERVAFLPPGLINHGNTCFMNSTLQGVSKDRSECIVNTHIYSTAPLQLIATSLLHELIRDGRLPPPFHDIAGTSIMSKRSPLLTNGRGGENQQNAVDGMALGDQFVNILQRAWGVQHERERQNLSPK